MASSVSEVSASQLGINEGEECDRQLDFDLGHLLACHPSAPSDPAVEHGSEEALHALATQVTQSLIRQIFSLPSHSTPDGRMVELPAPQLALPRFKPVPKPRPLTKWQKFAKEKGITKKKQSKLVYDDNAQDWKRRHGYKRGKDEAAVPVIEASDKDAPGEDPFTRLERERKDKVKRGKKSEAANIKDAARQGAVPSTVRLSTKLDPAAARGQLAKGAAMKGDIQSASYLAGVSTASMGKFDKRLRGEKGERKLPGMRKKHLPAAGSGEEGAAVDRVLGKVVRKGEEELVNVRRAVGNLNAQKAAAKAHGREGEGEEGRERRKKGRVGKVKNRRVPKKAPPAKGGVQKKGAKGAAKKKR